MNPSHMFNALDEIPEALEAEPEGFHAGFAIALAAEEAAEHGDLAYHLADRTTALPETKTRRRLSSPPRQRFSSTFFSN